MQDVVDNHTDNQESTIDLDKIFSRVIDNWHWFALSLLLFLGLAFTYIRYSAPSYKVNATLLVDDSKASGSGGNLGTKAVGGMLGDLGSLMSMNSNVDNEIQILQTKDLMEKVVRDMHLNISYFYVGIVGKPELFKDCPFAFVPLSDLDSLKQQIIIDVNYINNNVVNVISQIGKGEKNSQNVNIGSVFKIGTLPLKLISSGFIPAPSIIKKYQVKISINQCLSSH